MVIVPSVVLFIISISPLLIYEYGCFRLAQEIAWLKDHGRPTSWEEFYRKYPLTSEDSPEYRQLKEMGAKTPSSMSWYGSDPDNINKNLRESAEFRSLMQEWLKRVPADFFIVPDGTDPCRILLNSYMDLEYNCFSALLARKDWASAAAGLDGLWRCLRIESRNSYTWRYHDIPASVCRMMKCCDVDSDTLRRWMKLFKEDELLLQQNCWSCRDLLNVRRIVDAVRYSAWGYGSQVPYDWLRFTVPLWRARQLTMSREGFNTLLEYRYVSTRLKPKFLQLCFTLPFYLAERAKIDDRGTRCYIDLFFFDYFGDNNRYVVSVRANMRAVAAGIAVELYRREHGKLPGSLADLVPQYLEKVPLDPKTLKPMDYSLKPDNRYSIGFYFSPEQYQSYDFGPVVK